MENSVFHFYLAEDCPDVCMDLGIIIDGSDSISEDNWLDVEQYFADLVASFDVGPTMLQVGAERYTVSTRHANPRVQCPQGPFHVDHLCYTNFHAETTLCQP